jgi:hypothetical protein
MEPALFTWTLTKLELMEAYWTLMHSMNLNSLEALLGVAPDSVA